MSAKVIELPPPPEHPRSLHRRYRTGCDPVAWFVLEALAEYAAKDDVARVSLHIIARENRLGYSTVWRSVQRLVAIGYLARDPGNGRKVPWRLLVDPLEVRTANVPPAEPLSPMTTVTNDHGHRRPLCSVTSDSGPRSPVTNQVGSVGSTEVDAAPSVRATSTPRPANPKRKRAAKEYSLEAHALVREFRNAYIENADPDSGFREPIPTSELEAATKLLALGWPGERLTAMIQHATTDKPRLPDWRGWPARVQSVRALEKHYESLDRQAREKTRRPEPNARDSWSFPAPLPPEEDADA